MNNKTHQERVWSRQFGKDYTNRNIFSPRELDAFYKKTYGLSRTEMNARFLTRLNKNIKILEIGSNVGNQLHCLQKMGFKRLFGIEISEYAVELSKQHTKNINIIQGSAFDIPFRDAYFDLVFTSGLLIHISPKDIKRVLEEIYRCSGKYIWGFEYYSDTLTPITYRSKNNMLWKTNFLQLYLRKFPLLTLVKEEKYKYLSNDNVDFMFLLKKKI